MKPKPQSVAAKPRLHSKGQRPIQNVSGKSAFSMPERQAILRKGGSLKELELKEGKAVESGDPSLASSEVPTISKSLFDPLAVYPFKITQTGQFSSSVAGNIFTNTFWNPTGVGEFTSLSTLFSVVRIRRAKITLTSINPHADGYATGRIGGILFCACDYGLSGTNPSTIQAVIDCPNLLIMSLSSTRNHVLDTPNINNEFASTVTPAPGPYAGCFGQFSIAASGLTVSTLYVQWTLECVYEFTSRT